MMEPPRGVVVVALVADHGISFVSLVEPKFIRIVPHGQLGFSLD